MKTTDQAIQELNAILLLHQEAALKQNDSFAGEYFVLEYLSNKLNLLDGFIVDIAASDGFSQSCSFGFFDQKNWSGLAVEMDPIKFSKLSFLYSNFPKCRLARNRVTPNNVASILSSNEVSPNFDILNLDIDSYDLHVVDAMLKSEYRPKIITMEINEKIPSGIFFTVNFDELHYWQEDHFYGCSIDAAAAVVKPYGYILYCCEFNNAFFVRSDMANNVYLGTKFKDLTPNEAYRTGYRDRKNHLEIFPWNSDVDHWLSLSLSDAAKEINDLFIKYKGLYSLRLME